jgi:hypothetical protein
MQNTPRVYRPTDHTRTLIQSKRPPRHSFPLVKHNIRLLVLQPVLRRQIRRLKIRNLVIVEIPPRPHGFVFNKCSIVSTPQRRTNVPYNSISIIYERPVHRRIRRNTSDLRRPIGCMLRNISLLFLRHGRLDKWRHVERLQRELNRRADFARRLSARRAEALEVHDERIWRARNRNLLNRFAILLAARAPPDFVAGEALRRTIRLKAISQIARLDIWDLEAETPKRLVRGARDAAGLACELGCVLASEHAADDGHVTVLVAAPFDFCGVLAGELFAEEFFAVSEGAEGRFVPGYVEVFVHVV